MSTLIAKLREIDGGQGMRPLMIDIWPATPSAASITFARLDAASLAELQPDLVIFPLFGAGQDAIAVIERLQALGYPGRMVVICPRLPNPKLVETELRQLALGARLMLVIWDGSQICGLSAR